MPNEGGENSTNQSIVTALLRRVLLPLLIAAFGVILAVVMQHVDAPAYVLVLILVAVALVYVYVVMPDHGLTFIRTALRAVRVFFKWIVLLIIFIVVADVYISLRVPSAIKKAREGVRMIELALEQDRLCSLDSQSSNPDISRARQWIRYDSMSFETVIQELTSTRGGVSTASTQFYKNDHLVALRSPASGATGFIQTYYDGNCVVGVDHLDGGLAVQALDYLDCYRKNRHMDSTNLFWSKDDAPFRPTREDRPCLLGSQGGVPPNGSVSVPPLPSLGLPYR